MVVVLCFSGAVLGSTGAPSSMDTDVITTVDGLVVCTLSGLEVVVDVDVELEGTVDKVELPADSCSDKTSTDRVVAIGDVVSGSARMLSKVVVVDSVVLCVGATPLSFCVVVDKVDCGAVVLDVDASDVAVDVIVSVVEILLVLPLTDDAESFSWDVDVLCMLLGVVDSAYLVTPTKVSCVFGTTRDTTRVGVAVVSSFTVVIAIFSEELEPLCVGKGFGDEGIFLYGVEEGISKVVVSPTDNIVVSSESVSLVGVKKSSTSSRSVDDSVNGSSLIIVVSMASVSSPSVSVTLGRTVVKTSSWYSRVVVSDDVSFCPLARLLFF